MPDDDSSSPLEPYSTQFPAVDPWAESDPTITHGGPAVVPNAPAGSPPNVATENEAEPGPPEPPRPARRSRLPIVLTLAGVLAVGMLVVAVPLLRSADDDNNGQSPTEMMAGDQAAAPMGALTAPTSTATPPPSARASASTTPTTTHTASNPANSKSPKAAPPPARTGSLVNEASGKCLTGGGSGVPLTLQTCNASAYQRWELRRDGTIRAGGLCMDLPYSATDDLTQVQMFECNGKPWQQFHLNDTDDLVSRYAKKCLDAFKQRTANGTPIVLWPCLGQPNQSWHLK
ncbi:hypothetical protein GCM10027280_51250 [Micromonospora polyrhachis]|uniref:Ricin B lectin domain-containing protein n=1 Tax=Micromonospora polyrhachis TaxID=1282883 RepID=A0A7W7SW07_9ACTN|nr:RICIN domain-containing protein [Micromonospora polyrhachis]MBB4961959.1 hypothetical protein [Micromonospora polyrhachis]